MKFSHLLERPRDLFLKWAFYSLYDSYASPSRYDRGRASLYSFQGQSTMDEISGCSPYEASTITKPDGSRMPSENELAGARFQGRHVAQIASKLRA
jgi:multimeric flavodoxin WrbA